MPRRGGGDRALLAKLGSGSGSLSKFYSLHITPSYCTLLPPSLRRGAPKGRGMEATLSATMPSTARSQELGSALREAMTCGVGAELPSGTGGHNQQGCTMKPLDWSLGLPLCGTHPLSSPLCLHTKPSA